MRKKQRKRKIKYFFFFFLILILSFFLFAFLESKFLPPIKEISHIQCKTFANQIIDEAIAEILRDTDFSASSLLVQEEESYTANTLLVNQFCTLLSRKVTEGLQALPKESIRIPLGAATKWSFFANMGPEIPFTLIPMGTAKADYETSFSSVGINQINYKIWLVLSMEIKIVNPFYQETIAMQRKIMLVDLIFSGKIPEHYFQMSRPNEYLLTE